MRKKRSAITIKTETLLHNVSRARNLLYRYGVDEYPGVSHVGMSTSTSARIKAVQLFNDLSDTLNEMDQGVDAKLRLLIQFILIGKLKYSASPDMRTFNDWFKHATVMEHEIRDLSLDMHQFYQNVATLEAILDCQDPRSRVQQLMLLKLTL